MNKGEIKQIEIQNLGLTIFIKRFIKYVFLDIGEYVIEWFLI